MSRSKKRVKDTEPNPPACRQLEIVALMLDEAIALADQDLRAQRMSRLQKRASLFVEPPNSGIEAAQGANT